MYKQEDKEDFNGLLNDLQYHHNGYDNIDYDPDESDYDEYRIGSWEA